MNRLIALLGTVAFLASLALVPAQAGPSQDDQPAKKELNGAQVYRQNCGRCHQPRRPAERSDEEWEVIISHMRLRANLTGKEAEAVKKFLKDFNGR